MVRTHLYSIHRVQSDYYRMQAAQVYPILRDCDNNWATAAIIQQAGISIRKHEVAKGDLPSRAERIKSAGAKCRPTGPPETHSAKRHKAHPPVAIAAGTHRAQQSGGTSREGSKSVCTDDEHDDEDEEEEAEGLGSDAE